MDISRSVETTDLQQVVIGIGCARTGPACANRDPPRPHAHTRKVLLGGTRGVHVKSLCYSGFVNLLFSITWEQLQFPFPYECGLGKCRLEKNGYRLQKVEYSCPVTVS